MNATFYQSIMIISLVISLCVAFFAWRRRQLPGARAVVVLEIATFVWTLGFLLEANSNTLQRQLFFNNIGYIGVMLVPATWYVFALQYAWADKPQANWRRFLPIYILPLVAIVLVWTNPLHHLMWSNEHLTTSGGGLVTAKTYGPFFWVALIYNYALVLGGVFHLVRRMFVRTPLYIGQVTSLVVAAIVLLIWSIVYVFNLIPAPRKDLTPAVFAVSGIIIAVGVLRFRLLTVVPFAHRFIVEQQRDGILVFNMLNRLSEVNPAALKIVGAGKDIIGKELKELSLSLPVLEHLSPTKFGRVEISLNVSGENRFYELETIPMNDHHGQQIGWLATFHDVTEYKTLQEQLIAQDRLASIGQLVSGVAHELNNPLTSVVGFSELLLNRELPDDVKSDLKIVNLEANRTADIVKNLLIFARKQPESKIPIDVNDNIQGVLVLRDHEQKVNNINVNLHFAPDLPRITANGSQIQQVFFNIVVNAEQAMLEAHKKGTLTITTKHVSDIVRISIADDGPGISPDNMKKLFTPFFTTKGVGKGTGLGLSICHGIITELGGSIYAESEPGHGATFIIELPVKTATNRD